MDHYNYIKSLTKEQLAKWLVDNCNSEESPWILWWDKHYCKNCESVYEYVPYLNRECECAYCEVNGNCRFFDSRDDIPDDLEICQMWLEAQDCV